MEKAFDHPQLNSEMESPRSGRRPSKRVWSVLAVFVLASLYLSIDFALLSDSVKHPRLRSRVRVPLHAAGTLAKCRALSVKPAPPPGFSDRTQSDRYVSGTQPVLIRNASIWTGLGGDDGEDVRVVRGDILLENGLIQKCRGRGGRLVELGQDIVDVHSHIAVGSSPALDGADDVNSIKGLALPWLRSLDGLNTHDESYALGIAGGVTTSLILPGSADAIGGQAFTIKLRPTNERTPSSLLVDPPYGLNGTGVDYGVPPRWRHMKYAYRENPSGTYSGTRMDTVWSYREAYERARQIKVQQDDYCTKAFADEWDGLSEFPEDLQWEALIDILRGKVKVQTHCYEAVDFDAFVRLSNEFRFPVAAFHHAHEAYLVPGLLKQAYEHPPAIAMFASFSRYKREAYRHSEFAPRILNEQGIKVVMKSDHPGIHSRWLLHEAQQAHYYGLPANAALASVTTNAAEVIGLDHRLGYIKQGIVLDLVIWDSHPLALGATPVQVFIDGIPQLEESVSKKKDDRQVAPITPSFGEEAQAAVKFTGLPPLDATQITSGGVLFRNVSSMWQRDESGVHSVFQTRGADDEGAVLVEHGKVVCAGSMGTCSSFVSGERVNVINLERGSIAPALVSVGAALGLQEIAMETSTSDGSVLDPLEGDIPTVLGEGSIIRAVDGLMFGTRDALHAYRSGISTAITSPISSGLLGGLSTHFSLGAKHKLERQAVLSEVTAVHVAVLHRNGGPSISTQIAVLRRLLLGPYVGERGASFEAVVKGELPLVINVKNADIIASLVKLKQDVEVTSGTSIKMTLVGAGEAHLVAAELAAANVGVIVTPSKTVPAHLGGSPDDPPITEQSLVTTLFAHGVTVGIGHQGVEEDAQMSTWAARNLRWDAAWASIDSGGLISIEDAFNMATTNVERLLGVTTRASESDVVATKGGDLLSFEGKVVAVTSARRGVVDLFEYPGQDESRGIQPQRRCFGFVMGGIRVLRWERRLALTAQGRSSRLQILMIPSYTTASSSHPCEVGRVVRMRQNPALVSSISLDPHYVVVERDQVIRSPDHLDDVHMAAWPVGGLTAWRAAIVNARVAQGHNVLITGIGGGVALIALQLCLTKGATVFVTSGSEDKLAKAVALGASGGVNYKSADWPHQLAKLLEMRGGSGLLDAVIDSGGGDIMGQVNKILKPGGRVNIYGMTANPVVKFTMREVLKQHQLIGSTMGSRQDLIDATRFIAEHAIVPAVSHVLEGLEFAEDGFELMKHASQFGKIVIRMDGSRQVAARL
ncbi:hypothetical protein JVU11DRAFT_5810 [Chiua virens]|nr:hypothetical protein JVU11DRAFT_5810 [Chiua virens]